MNTVVLNSFKLSFRVTTSPIEGREGNWGLSEIVSTSTGCRLTKSGVAVIGLGRGQNRPTLTFDGAVGADISVGANAHSVWLENLLLKSGIDALEHVIYLDASQGTLMNLEYDQVGAFEAAKVIEVSSAAKSVLIDGLICENATDAGGSQMDNVIYIVDPSHVEIRNCRIAIATSGGLIASTSGNSADNQPNWIHHNLLENTTTDACIQWSSINKTIGLVVNDNMFKVVTGGANGMATASGAGTTSIWAFHNLEVNVDGEQGTLEVFGISDS